MNGTQTNVDTWTRSGNLVLEVTSTTLDAQPGEAAPQLDAGLSGNDDKRLGDDLASTMRLVKEHVAFERRLIRANDVIYRTDETFASLFILSSGLVKLVSHSNEGREHVVCLKFKGDWMGFDGIAEGEYTCDAVAMDTGEVWVVRYSAMLAACLRRPQLMTLLHAAMSRAISGDRDSLLAVCTLPADARVADFIRYLAQSQADRGMRCDQISLRMTRAEIGDYLGLTLETVSRALSKLARSKMIEFNELGRKEVGIPDLKALSAFVRSKASHGLVLRDAAT